MTTNSTFSLWNHLTTDSYVTKIPRWRQRLLPRPLSRHRVLTWRHNETWSRCRRKINLSTKLLKLPIRTKNWKKIPFRQKPRWKIPLQHQSACSILPLKKKPLKRKSSPELRKLKICRKTKAAAKFRLKAWVTIFYKILFQLSCMKLQSKLFKEFYVKNKCFILSFIQSTIFNCSKYDWDFKVFLKNCF